MVRERGERGGRGLGLGLLVSCLVFLLAELRAVAIGRVGGLFT